MTEAAGVQWSTAVVIRLDCPNSGAETRERLAVYLQFREEFDLPAHRIFPYFATPADWATLYGAAGDTKTKGDGWYAVPLKRFPFPLVARNVAAQPDRLVRWVFGGFWRGVGEVQLIESGRGTVVEGFEYITAHGFWSLATAFEECFMTAEFERIWALGWNRIRRNEEQYRS
ncbi:hypothetical protein [Mycobacterium asiaticum]|uniref:hypothetical protein n=1 Tax=Mycobacterium asiaticum TaxID=1790 RepID=UPI0012DB1AED|nr:hypothetical protein [Mycobacterium asiaticum]